MSKDSRSAGFGRGNQWRTNSNIQAGGGAFIVATLWVEGPHRYKEFVLERIRCALPECEDVEDMYVQC